MHTGTTQQTGCVVSFTCGSPHSSSLGAALLRRATTDTQDTTVSQGVTGHALALDRSDVPRDARRDTPRPVRLPAEERPAAEGRRVRGGAAGRARAQDPAQRGRPVGRAGGAQAERPPLHQRVLVGVGARTPRPRPPYGRTARVPGRGGAPHRRAQGRRALGRRGGVLRAAARTDRHRAAVVRRLAGLAGRGRAGELAARPAGRLDRGPLPAVTGPHPGDQPGTESGGERGRRRPACRALPLRGSPSRGPRRAGTRSAADGAALRGGRDPADPARRAAAPAAGGPLGVARPRRSAAHRGGAHRLDAPPLAAPCPARHGRQGPVHGRSRDAAGGTRRRTAAPGGRVARIRPVRGAVVAGGRPDAPRPRAVAGRARGGRGPRRRSGGHARGAAGLRRTVLPGLAPSHHAGLGGPPRLRAGGHRRRRTAPNGHEAAAPRGG